MKANTVTKQAMPLSIVLIRRQIENRLVGISELLPEGYKITFFARTEKHDNAEIILTEDNLQKVVDILSEHIPSQTPNNKSSEDTK